MKEEFLMVYVTTGSLVEAQKIAKEVVQSRLAACANILPQMQSVYWWNDEINFDEEVVLIMKIPEKNFQFVEEKIKTLHSYDCPCIVALDLKAGSPEYLKWLADETKI